MLHNQLKKILPLGGDFLVLYISLYLTLVIRYRALPSLEIWNLHFQPFSWLFAVWLIIFYINGLYDLTFSKNDVQFYNKMLATILVNYALGAAYFYLLTDKLFEIKPQIVYFIFMALSLAFFSFWRYLYNTLLSRPKFLRKVLIIGIKDEAWELIEEISKKPQLGYQIVAVIHNHNPGVKHLPQVKFHDPSVDIKKVLREEKISTVITSLDPRSNPDLVRNLFESLSFKIQFYDLPIFYEKLTGKIPVTTIGHIWFLENLAEADKSLYEFFKRLFDITIALAGLVVSLPVMPIIAVFIKLSSPGPVLFRQNRLGYLGRPFLAIKFRSMVSGAEKNGEAQWAQVGDPRITKFGRFLRKTRLDEIPQLLNILKGEMSLIGPRPERPEFVRQLQEIIPFYNERHLVKPGLTGWAQINFQYGASAGDALKKLQYDLFYIKNRSLPLDLAILLKTVNIILTGRGQ